MEIELGTEYKCLPKPAAKAVLLVLQQAFHQGISEVSCRGSTQCGISRWGRFWNWLSRKVGADREPFTDPYNYHNIKSVDIARWVKRELIEQSMFFLADKPVCKLCGSSENLQPDPAGYYVHAENYRGAPLLCTKSDPAHEKVNHP